ncbi:MAG: hypothetical protein IJS61_04620 [Firmicutes bacterium]|nr:hypothetical protein [Bacillota bacterium]
MVEINLEKIYSFHAKDEPVFVGVPFKKGKVKSTENLVIKDENGVIAPSHIKVTGHWDDGSVKWIFADFLADIPANKSAKYYLDESQEKYVCKLDALSYKDNTIDNGNFKIKLSNTKEKLFDSFSKGNFDISSFKLEDIFGNVYTPIYESPTLVEENPLKNIVEIRGKNVSSKRSCSFVIRLTSYINKNYFDIGYTLINDNTEPLSVKSLSLDITKPFGGSMRQSLAHSNYKTKYTANENGDKIQLLIDADHLLSESNEHNPEVFYGTFFGDISDSEGGVSATVYQAQQNYPKALEAEKGKLTLYLVPEGIEDITFYMGMQKEHTIRIYLHDNESLEAINNVSTIFQMPYRALLKPEVYENSGVFGKNIFVKNKVQKLELYLGARADEHARSYGILSWGDTPDMGYTAQGRGGGKLVWTNNEYDFPHACATEYVRTGTRRFLEYLFVSAKHWMDVDVCHYSDDPLEIGGQWEHSRDHINGRVMVCSHQWVEGLLDYYHFSGDIRAYNTALSIAENVSNLLDTPPYRQEGETSARETGWALRTLAAMYNETKDKKWLEKCDFIVGHFTAWKEKYGLWLSPYTDNTKIRVVFMIAIAVNSLMRYYDICPTPSLKEHIKDMVLEAVDDIIENCRLDNGLFYYKELPSLQRNGNNPIILEALSYAYEITGDKKYIEAGLPTLEYVTSLTPSASQAKKHIESSVLYGTGGSKNFAQMMIPITVFYKFASDLALI